MYDGTARVSQRTTNKVSTIWGTQILLLIVRTEAGTVETTCPYHTK